MLPTVLALKNSRIPPSMGLCKDDPRLIQYFNEFQSQALNHGRWYGSIINAQFCSYGGLVAWPRQVASVEQITICGQTVLGQNIFYAFMSPVSQPGICQDCNNRGNQANNCACGSMYWAESTNQPVYKQLHAPRLIKIYPRSTTDVGKKVLVQGYDENDQWVSNQYSGIFVDGEYVTIGSPFGISSTKFKNITGIQKDVTDKNLLAYALNTDSHTEEHIATWEPTETAPSYRTSYIPRLGHRNRNNQNCKPGTIQALIKLQHIDVFQDTDWLIIQNEAAIKHGMKARQLYEQNQSAAANEQLVLAISELNHELRTYTSDRTTGWVDLGAEVFRLDLQNFY